MPPKRNPGGKGASRSSMRSSMRSSNAGMTSVTKGVVKPPKNKKADDAAKREKLAAAAWSLKENDFAREAMNRILTIRDLDLIDATAQTRMVRQPSGCDDQTGDNCTHYCFSRFLAREITKQLNINLSVNKDNVRDVVKIFCENIKQLEESTLLHAYTLLKENSNNELLNINISYDDYEFYPKNAEMVAEFESDIRRIIDNVDNHGPESTGTQIYFKSYYPVYLILQHIFEHDAMFLYSSQCENYKGPLNKADAYVIMTDEVAYYNANGYKNPLKVTMRNKSFYNYQNKSVPGHAMNIVGVKLSADYDSGNYNIIDFMIIGSWVDCDGSKAYTSIPKNFVFNHMYMYVLVEMATVGGKRNTEKRKKKHDKSKKQKQTRRRIKTRRLFNRP